MRKVVVALVAGALALGVCVSRGPAAPALPEKAVRYEYAELQVVRTVVGAPGGGGLVPVAPAGPGMPPPAQRALQTTIRWATAEELVEFKDWEELADKLKAPVAKKESPPTVHKLRVLNKLSADGWEMLDRILPDTTGISLAFRRRLP